MFTLGIRKHKRKSTTCRVFLGKLFSTQTKQIFNKPSAIKKQHSLIIIPPLHLSRRRGVKAARGEKGNNNNEQSDEQH